nr:ribosomal protein S4 [Brasenia schreberi]
MPALRFKTCRPLPGNVRNRELTIIQRRILRRLRKKNRSIKRKIYPRKNLNSYIKSLTFTSHTILSCPSTMSLPAIICNAQKSRTK